ncbi:MAG: outer membrane protein [Hyphomicrobiaceae bacterium]
MLRKFVALVAVVTASMTGGISAVSAADLGGARYGSLKDDPVYERRATWTGFYLGAHVGYSWGGVDHAQTNGGMPYGPYSYDTDGFLGGATLGFNVQYQSLVAGLEADLGYMDTSGDGRIPSSVPTAYQKIWLDGGFYALAAARLGVAFDRTLIYAKGGRAYLNGEAGQQTTNPGYVTHTSGSLDGWAYGGGVEHKVSDKMSIKLEYLHFDFDTVTGDQTSVSDPPIGYVYTNKSDASVDTVKVGINFHF